MGGCVPSRAGAPSAGQDKEIRWALGGSPRGRHPGRLAPRDGGYLMPILRSALIASS
jgi:hypothetical protein